MNALAVTALVLALAGGARAETPLLHRTDAPWFVGASVQSIRDGRVGRIAFHHHEGPTGLGHGLEGGRVLRRWISIAWMLRRAHLSEWIYTDPGNVHFNERQIRIGPRIDVWPVPGWIRVGAAFIRSWRQSERVSNTGQTSRGPRSDDTYELQVGVVPLQWRGFEVELNGSVSQEKDKAAAAEGRFLSTYTYGLTLRWRMGSTARRAAPPPAPSPGTPRPSGHGPPGM